MADSLTGPDEPRIEPVQTRIGASPEKTITEGVSHYEPTPRGSRHIPESIGQYRLRRVIGEGGMGTVFEAEQQNPRRIVALKVLKAAVASPQMLRRFELEGEALARLQHPGIAQIYESGAAESPSGVTPFFAMEYVAGLPLNRYAKAHRLDTRARLDLLARICDAVHHAHQRGIIHRDLKPGNILVDGSGQPKILDFGVARFTDSDAHATRQTDVGQLLGTLTYMSPEQALGNPLEIDIRSDIYTLGVILYELLAEKLPYTFESGSLLEVVRTIRETEPTSLHSINRAYRGDITILCAKALEKDKSRRYASAADMATDIRRHLADQPILAQPPTLSYQLGKFARRHRVLVGGIAAVFVVLVGGVLVSLREASRARAAEQAAVVQRDRASAAEAQARAERDRAVRAETQAEAGRTLAETQRRRADAESASAKAINDFLERDLLAQASSDNQSQPDPNLKVVTALDRAAAGIAGKFGAQPEVEASLRLTIGKTYEQLSSYTEAQPHLERALELRRKLFGREDVRSIEALEALARLTNNREKTKEAVRLYEEAVALRRKISGPEHPATLGTIAALANAYDNADRAVQSGRGGVTPLHQRVRALEREVYEVRRRVLGPEHPDTLQSVAAMSEQYKEDGKVEEAMALVREGLAIQRKLHGPDHRVSLAWEGKLAEYYGNQGRLAESEQMRQHLLDVSRRVHSPGDEELLREVVNFGYFYLGTGKLDRAEPMLREVVEAAEPRLGLNHSLTLVAYSGLARVYNQQRKWAQAEEIYAKTLSAPRIVGNKNSYLARLRDLAISRYNQAKWPAAEADFRAALETGRKEFGPEYKGVLTVAYWLANTLMMQSRFAEAEPLMLNSLEILRGKFKEDDDSRLNQEDALARLYLEQGRSAEAERVAAGVLAIRRRGTSTAATLNSVTLVATICWKEGKFAESEALARESVESYRREKDDTWVLYQAKALLGASLAGLRRFEEAEPLLLEGYSGIESRKGSLPAGAHNRLIHPARELARLYRAWGKPEEAAEWEKKN